MEEASGTIRPTKKQQALLEFIGQFINEHGYSPSYREIMNGCQYNSVATVALHVSSLIKRGHLRKREHSARSIEVVKTEIGAETSVPEQSAAAAEENWLVSQIKTRLAGLETAASFGENQLAEIAALIEAAKILGLHNEAEGLTTRLVVLQNQI